MKKFVGYDIRSFNFRLCVFISLIGLLFLSSSAFADQFGDFTYTVNVENTVTITGYTGAGGNVVIPSIIEGMPVVGIGINAFSYIGSLTSVVIPDSVASIGEQAFYGCDALTSIFVYASNTVYSSQDGVLYDKTKTLLIQFPSGKTGGFKIPASVTSICN